MNTEPAEADQSDLRPTAAEDWTPTRITMLIAVALLACLFMALDPNQPY